MDIKQHLASQKESAAKLLQELISIKSTACCEHEVQKFLFDYLSKQGFAPQFEDIDEKIVDDPDYTVVPGLKDYHGRPNILVNLPGSGGGRSAIINSHSDVVPATDEMFVPRYEDSIVYGRGACDAKGQVLTVILALETLKVLGLKLKGDLQAQLVIEEEAGGNGSLSVIKQGHKADVAVVLEPTSLKVHPANRGAVWYKLAVDGKSAHMGKYWDGISAIDEMVGLIKILREYEQALREESKGSPLFPFEPSPVNVNIGQINGGDWPATVPANCWIEGGIAFLPNRRIAQIYDEVHGLIDAKASEWAKQHYTFEFSRLHNEAFETDVNHPAVKSFCEIAGSVLGPEPLLGWIASCDGRLFYHTGQMPTIVFGAGDLGYAHSLNEQVKMDDILRAAEVLTLFLIDWCGA
ncbi:ArgE/DapE family deacylase [bacterium]|nr:ArgE/DapE family deacylase [bacterium]